MIMDNLYLKPNAINKADIAQIKNKIYVYSPNGFTQLNPK